MQVVEVVKVDCVRSVDEPPKNLRVGASNPLWVRVVFKNVLLKLREQERIVLVVKMKRSILGHGFLSIGVDSVDDYLAGS